MILGIGTAFEIMVAIAVYMVALVFVTEFAKKFCVANGGGALILSWIVGVGIFIGLHFAGCFKFNFAAVVLFVFITGVTNRLYKWETLKEFVRKLMKTEM